MEHADFSIGGTFWCSGRQWRCTDIGTRAIVAIRIDSVAVDSTDPARRRTLSRAEADVGGWFNGPPTSRRGRVRRVRSGGMLAGAGF